MVTKYNSCDARRYAQRTDVAVLLGAMGARYYPDVSSPRRDVELSKLITRD